MKRQNVKRKCEMEIDIWYENGKQIGVVGFLKRVCEMKKKKREGGQRYTSQHLKKFFSDIFIDFKSVTLGY